MAAGQDGASSTVPSENPRARISSHKVIVALIVQEILDERIAKKLA